MKQFDRDDFGFYLWGRRHALQPLFSFYYRREAIKLKCWDYIPRELDRYNWGDVYND